MGLFGDAFWEGERLFGLLFKELWGCGVVWLLVDSLPPVKGDGSSAKARSKKTRRLSGDVPSSKFQGA